MTGTKEDMIVAFHVLKGWKMEQGMRDGLQKQIANTRANSREEGRKEGLEDAAQWHERRAAECLIAADRAKTNAGEQGAREAVWLHDANAKAIRALQNTPAEDKP